MARNKIQDLRDHLFAQLERLGDDEDMKNPLKLEKELKRADAISKVATQLVASAKVEVDFLSKVGLPPGNDSGFLRNGNGTNKLELSDGNNTKGD